MPLLPTPSHQRRKARGHPAEHEESAAHSGAIENLQQLCCVFRHPALVSLPIRTRYGTIKGGDLKVVLHVDGHHVDNAASGVRRGAHRAPLRMMTVFSVSSRITKSSAIDRFLM